MNAPPTSPVIQPSATPNAASTQPLNVNAIGRRISAGIIELIIWFVLFIIASQIFGSHDVLKTVSTTTNSAGQTVNQGQKLTYQSNLSGVPMLIFSLTVLAYYVLFEWLAGGTISKLILRLKVVGLNGQRISLKQALVRNLLRLIDDFPYFIPYLTGLIILNANTNKQRLGDKLAHTLVVRK